MNEPLRPSRKEILTPKRIHGAIPAVVTPLTQDNKLDIAGINMLSDFLIREGVAALFVLGTTGESDFIPTDLKRNIIKTYVEASKGRVPVLAGVSEPDLDDTFSLSQDAIKLGVDAIVIKPLYIEGDPEVNIRALFQIIRRFPIMLYNNPGTHRYGSQGKSISIEILRVALEYPNFMGIKDSSNNLTSTLGYIKACKTKAEEGVGVWQGFPNLGFKSLKAGAAGLVQSLANIEPGLFVNLCNSMQRGDIDTATTQQQQIDSLFATYPFDLQHVPFVKARLVEMGLIASPNMFPKNS